MEAIFDMCHCQICFSLYEERAHEPHVLPCGHNLCTISLEKMLS